MKAQIISWIETAIQALNHGNYYMPWNLFLAFIPLALSVWLFHQSTSRSILWWGLLLVFIAFLPNAPYVLTDIIHLVELIRQGYPMLIIVLAVIPQYLIFILAGVQAYVISLMNLGDYLYRKGQGKYVQPIELFIHVLCAIGIYLGRFRRFNSWDFITGTDRLIRIILHDLTSKLPLLLIGITFVVLVVTYWLFKQVNLGILFRLRYRKHLSRNL